MSGTDFYYEPQVRLAEEIAAIVPIDGGVRSFFGNSGTEAIEACLKLARYATGRPNIIAFLGGVPRPHDGRAGADGEQGDPAARLRPVDAGRVSRAVRRTAIGVRSGSKPETCAAECLDFIEHQLFVHLVSPDEVAADRRRADSGRRRLRRRARPVSAAAARADDAARHPAGRRRSAVGHGPHRARCSRSSTRASSRTSIAIAKGIASGLPLGVAAARAGSDDVAARRAREHVRRQPGVVRGGARDDQAAEGAADRERRRRRRASDGRARRR